MSTPVDVRERLLSHVVVRGNGCWGWEGARTRNGYGRVSYGGKITGAHQAFYREYVGEIPPGNHIDHLCHVADGSCEGGWSCLHRSCVNPEHLDAKTPLENRLRGMNPIAQNASKTHCVRGHPYDDKNTLRYKNCRWCRTCAHERMRRKRLLQEMSQ